MKQEVSTFFYIKKWDPTVLLWYTQKKLVETLLTTTTQRSSVAISKDETLKSKKYISNILLKSVEIYSKKEDFWFYCNFHTVKVC